MRHRNRILVVSIWSCMISVTGGAVSFESTLTLQTKDVVPESLLSGVNHKLNKTIETNGVQNQYWIETNYGQFGAEGLIELRVRIREVDAIAYLDQVSKTDIFLNALKDAGINSAISVVSAVRNPVQTVKGLPSGVRKVFSGYVQGAKRGVVSTKRLLDGESASVVQDPRKFKELNYVVSESERRWASELSVDPYSANMELRAAISNVAVVQFMGGLPVDIALPVTASLAIGMLGEVGDQIYSVSAKELEISNRECLGNAGLSGAQIHDFFSSDYMTPTMHTIYCSATRRLEGVESLGLSAEQLVAARSFFESRFLLQTVSLLAWYHAEVKALERLIVSPGVEGGVLYAKTSSQGLLLITPTDYLMWTEVIASRIGRVTLEQENETGQKSIWIMGQASDRARLGLAELNWKLHDRFNDDRMASLHELGLSAGANADVENEE